MTPELEQYLQDLKRRRDESRIRLKNVLDLFEERGISLYYLDDLQKLQSDNFDHLEVASEVVLQLKDYDEACAVMSQIVNVVKYPISEKILRNWVSTFPVKGAVDPNLGGDLMILNAVSKHKITHATSWLYDLYNIDVFRTHMIACGCRKKFIKNWNPDILISQLF